MTGAVTETAAASVGRHVLLAAACLAAALASSFVLHSLLSSNVETAPTNALRDHEPASLELRLVAPTEGEVAGTGGSEGMRSAVDAIRAAALEHGWDAGEVSETNFDLNSTEKAYALHSAKGTTEVDVMPVDRVSGSPYTEDGSWLLRLTSRTSSQQASRFIVNGFAIAMVPVFAGLYAYAWSWVRRFRNTKP